MLDVKFIVFSLLYLFYFFFMKPHVSTDVMVLRSFMFLLFVAFLFWDGKQNLVPNVCQVVFANMSLQGRVVDPYIYGLFNSSSHVMPFPAYNL